MTKAIVVAFSLLLLGSVAEAAPGTPPRHETGAAQTHKYWLSDGLNRLVFWQPQAAREHSQTH